MKADYTEKEILQAKTPAAYIDRCLKSKVGQGRKTYLARIWMKKTGYIVQDIMRARGQHPHWKAVRSAGYQGRNAVRFTKYDYSPMYRTKWFVEKIVLFIEKNKKVEDVYMHKDWEMARMFESTIPGIQSWRRKYNLVVKLGKRPGSQVFLRYIQIGENQLRQLVSVK